MILFEVSVRFINPVEKLKEEFSKGNSMTDHMAIASEINREFSIGMFNKNKHILPLMSGRNITAEKINIYMVYILENKIYPSYEVLFRNVNSAAKDFILRALDANPEYINTRIIETSGLKRKISSDSMGIDDIISKYIDRRTFETAELDRITLDNMYNKSLFGDLEDELFRIENNSFKSFHGHPVHYLIRYEDRNTVPNIILHTLNKNNRGVSVCCATINASEINNRDIEMVYDSCIGNSIVFEIEKVDTDDDNISRRSSGSTPIGYLNKILKTSLEYSPSILTFIAINDVSDKDKILELAIDNDVIYVPIFPKNVNNSDGLKYLNSRAKQDGFKKYAGESLNALVYTPSDLDRIYTQWKTSHLIRSMGYDKMNMSNLKKTLSFDPMEKLNKMIGLSSVKETVNNILSYFKMQKVYLEKGITTSNPCRHMVFYGNPGTAKTTVARLIADILKKGDIITNGKLVEVGRSQLVGEYVGHTAIKTRKVIRSAKGGILFIDEAYSLVDRAGSFGEEAINTLVQEMDNIREDTIVILAGYPDKMENFMNTNPGIRSRIGFHVKFENYNKPELMEILHLLAKKEKFTLTKEALILAEKQISAAMSTKDFGNGRFVRSLLEQAIMKQATRIAKDDSYIDMDNEEIFTIESHDISNMNKAIEKSKVGFNI